MIKTNKKMTNIQFWVLSCSWGIVMTLVGFVTTLVLLVTGHKPKRNQYSWYFEIGESWGGLELGCMCLTSKNPSQHTLNHEFGHQIQNCIYGPFMICISIASAIRYHYRNWIKKHKPTINLSPYDSIWFEGEATKIGDYYKNN